jgi:hypothetical protein
MDIALFILKIKNVQRGGTEDAELLELLSLSSSFNSVPSAPSR